MLVRNPVLHQSTKHIRIQAHFIREKVDSGDVNLKYVEIKKQVADFLTKAWTREKTEFCRGAVGLE
jgi:ATP sulfurylase